MLAGLCAGSMCWFEGGVTASFGTRLAPLRGGLGLLPGSNCPHYNVRRDAYMDALRDGLAPGLAAEDGVALHFVDRRLAAVVASRDGPRAPTAWASPATASSRRRCARSLLDGAAPPIAAGDRPEATPRARRGAVARGERAARRTARMPTSGGR